jgi:hypothetical protein
MAVGIVVVQGKVSQDVNDHAGKECCKPLESKPACRYKCQYK